MKTYLSNVLAVIETEGTLRYDAACGEYRDRDGQTALRGTSAALLREHFPRSATVGRRAARKLQRQEASR